MFHAKMAKRWFFDANFPATAAGFSLCVTRPATCCGAHTVWRPTPQNVIHPKSANLILGCLTAVPIFAKFRGW